MNIYNLKNKIVVEISELSDLIGSTNPENLFYSISKYNTNNCLESVPSLTGPVPLNFTLNVQLPDGRYNIDISGIEGKDNYNGDLNQDFFIIYNRLPNIVESIVDILCYEDCPNCTGKNSEDTLLKAFFEFNLFLTCTGLTNELPAYRETSCDFNQNFSNACDYEKNFGKFNFDYSASIRKILSVGLVELYTREAHQIRLLNTDLGQIKTMFDLTNVERCLYNIGSSLDQILKHIRNINCDCNG